MDVEELRQRIAKAVAEHFNSDGDRISVSLDRLDDDAPIGIHNFNLSISIPIKE